jgi:hypothetical protein
MELEITAHEVGLCTRDELRDAIHSLELKIESFGSELSLKIETVRNDLNVKIEREIRSLEGRMTRFVVTCLLAQTALIAGALYFSLAHYRP